MIRVGMLSAGQRAVHRKIGNAGRYTVNDVFPWPLAVPTMGMPRRMSSAAQTPGFTTATENPCRTR
jgi:hypothetical protein